MGARGIAKHVGSPIVLKEEDIKRIIKSVQVAERPKLGMVVDLQLFRLLRHVGFQITLPDQAVADNLLYKVGMNIGKFLPVKTTKDIAQLIEDLKIGVIQVSDNKREKIRMGFSECVTCSGINPPIGRAVCSFEVGLVEGMVGQFKQVIGKSVETQCIGGLGDDICLVEIPYSLQKK